MAAKGRNFKRRKLLVIEDEEFEVVLGRTNETVMKLPVRYDRKKDYSKKGEDSKTVKKGTETPLLPRYPLASHRYYGPDGGASNSTMFPPTNEEPAKTKYHQHLEKTFQEWVGTRESFFRAGVESAGMPLNRSCVVCELRDAVLRCKDCGANHFFCRECGIVNHQHRNKFHYLEQWTNHQEFCPFLEQPIPVLNFPTSFIHTATCTKSVRLVTIVDSHGRQHLANIWLCSCKSDGECFILNGFWPATPHKPQLGFDFKLLDLIEGLLLGSQMSLKGFCDSIKETLPKLIQNNGKDIYNALKGETYSEYRYFKYQMRTLQQICPELSPGNICPACPKDSGPIYYALDACFGLVRKKKASKHVLPSRHSDLYFIDQENVDDFVDSYNLTKTSRKDCSNFNAGSAVSENLIRNKLFDIKAIFGSVCRHEFPKKFLNLKHGERIAYSVKVIKEQLEELSTKPEIQLHVSYDIACILKRHLQSSHQNSLLEKIKLGLPAFHTYAHQPSCQVSLGAKYCDQLGLTDGEQCERLWSYLRCFSSMTKEMTASHRHDLLTDALLYYGRRTAIKLPELLCTRLQRSKKILAESDDALKALLATLPTNTTTDMVAEWVEEQKKETLKSKGTLTGDDISWQKEYVQMILSSRQLRQNIMIYGSKEDEIAQDVGLLRSAEKDLKSFEKKHNVLQRWDLASKTAKDLLQEVIEEERQELVRNLRVLAYERLFLIDLKRKYADGQKLAKSLSRAINRKVSDIEKLIAPYNKKLSYLERHMPKIKEKIVEKTQAFDVTSNIYTEFDVVGPVTEIPTCIKVKAVNLYLTWQRAIEEVSLLAKDAENTTKYFLVQRQHLLNRIEQLDDNSLFSIGSRALLFEELALKTLFIFKAVALFERPDCYENAFDVDFDEIKRTAQCQRSSAPEQDDLSEEDDYTDDNDATDDDCSDTDDNNYFQFSEED